MSNSFQTRIAKDWTLRRFSGVTADDPEKYFYVLMSAKLLEALQASGLKKYQASQIGIIVLEGLGEPTPETDEEARRILKERYLKPE